METVPEAMIADDLKGTLWLSNHRFKDPVKQHKFLIFTYSVVTELLTANWKVVEELVTILLVKKTITGKEFYRFFKSQIKIKSPKTILAKIRNFMQYL